MKIASRSVGMTMIGIASGAALCGCIGSTALSQLSQVRPLGDPFSQELYKNYAFLAQSFGSVGTPTSGSPFDVDSSIRIGGGNLRVADVANTFAEKAITAAQGNEVLPEGPPPGAPDGEVVHLRLLRALDQGRGRAPVAAARAQAEYDCCVVDGRAIALRKASLACRKSLDESLPVVEAALAPPPAPPQSPAPAPTEPVTMAPAESPPAAPGAPPPEEKLPGPPAPQGSAPEMPPSQATPSPQSPIQQ